MGFLIVVEIIQIIRESAVKAFLRTCTRNACLNHLDLERNLENKKKLVRDLYEDHEEPFLSEMIKMEVLAEIRKLFKQLPEERRRIFILGYVKGVPNGKIAQLLNLSTHTVKNQKSTGLQTIKKWYKEQDRRMDQTTAVA